MKLYHPGRDAAERYPDWVIRHRPLPDGIPEVMCRRRRVILINAGHSWVEKRCSLAHAVAHLDLGHHEVPGGPFTRMQERDANRLAAGRLIPIERLAEVLVWTQSPAEVAAELEVDRPMLGHFEQMLLGPRLITLRKRLGWVAGEAIA